MPRSALLVPTILLTGLLTACGANPAAPEAAPEIASPAENDVCDQELDTSMFDLAAAGRVASLGEDFNVEALGQAGAQAMALDLLSLEGSFCSYDLPAGLADDLDQIDQLYSSGQQSQADDLLTQMLQKVDADEYSALGRAKFARPLTQAGGDQARRKVHAYLRIAARAQLWGNNERGDEALSAANDTFSAWAEGAIDSATVQEALRIATEAQLLGLDELGDSAIAHARDLVEVEFNTTLDAFDPCLASESDARYLLKVTAQAMLLGVDTGQGFMVKIDEWREIQKKRADGEVVAQCETWQLELTLDTSWQAGFHHIEWKGDFSPQDDGSLEGSGSGSLSSHVEASCANVLTGEVTNSTTDVSGSFTFDIQGKQATRQGEQVFLLQLPAEVTVSGVDTCNPFDETSYLPKYVIEEVHSSGGVEGYDPASDQIYLLLPAQDGASRSFDTVIGPVTASLQRPPLDP